MAENLVEIASKKKENFVSDASQHAFFSTMMGEHQMKEMMGKKRWSDLYLLYWIEKQIRTHLDVSCYEIGILSKSTHYGSYLLIAGQKTHTLYSVKLQYAQKKRD